MRRLKTRVACLPSGHMVQLVSAYDKHDHVALGRSEVVKTPADGKADWAMDGLLGRTRRG